MHELISYKEYLDFFIDCFSTRNAKLVIVKSLKWQAQLGNLFWRNIQSLAKIIQSRSLELKCLFTNLLMEFRIYTFRNTIATSIKTIAFFMAVRNPFDRLVSTYYNKVFPWRTYTTADFKYITDESKSMSLKPLSTMT